MLQRDVCVAAEKYIVARGLRRAYKYNDKPTVEQIEDQVLQAIMFEIAEWFVFDGVPEERH